MKTKTMNHRLILLGVFPILGFALMYLVPMGMTFEYALLDNTINRKWVGVDNLRHVWSNRYFLMGMRNLIILGGGMVLFTLLFALILSFLLCRHPRIAGKAMAVLVLPLLIPSVAVVSVWRTVFDTVVVRTDGQAITALISLFMWKFSGVAAVILYAGLKSVPQSVLDAAALDGAGEIRTFVRIRLPMSGGNLVMAVVFLLMYMFRIFKESYLLFEDTGTKSVYMVQHYMNRVYLRMDFQYVAAAAVSLIMVALLLYGGTLLMLRYRRTYW